jgi:hypothetical protein
MTRELALLNAAAPARRRLTAVWVTSAAVLMAGAVTGAGAVAWQVRPTPGPSGPAGHDRQATPAARPAVCWDGIDEKGGACSKIEGVKGFNAVFPGFRGRLRFCRAFGQPGVAYNYLCSAADLGIHCPGIEYIEVHTFDTIATSGDTAWIVNGNQVGFSRIGPDEYANEPGHWVAEVRCAEYPFSIMAATTSKHAARAFVDSIDARPQDDLKNPWNQSRYTVPPHCWNGAPIAAGCPRIEGVAGFYTAFPALRDRLSQCRPVGTPAYSFSCTPADLGLPAAGLDDSRGPGEIWVYTFAPVGPNVFDVAGDPWMVEGEQAGSMNVDQVGPGGEGQELVKPAWHAVVSYDDYPFEIHALAKSRKGAVAFIHALKAVPPSQIGKAPGSGESCAVEQQPAGDFVVKARVRSTGGADGALVELTSASGLFFESKWDDTQDDHWAFTTGQGTTPAQFVQTTFHRTQENLRLVGNSESPVSCLIR